MRRNQGAWAVGVVISAGFGYAACGGSDGSDLFPTTAATTGSGGATSSSETSSTGTSGGMTSAGGGGASSVTTGTGGSSSSSGGSGGASSSSSSASSSSASVSSSSGGPMCGNGIAEAGEECDGKDFAGASCKDYNFSNPVGLVCTKQCTIDSSGCMPTCDGKLLEPGEVCDGQFIGAGTCTDFGFVNPNGLVCTPDCLGYDYSGCVAVCGNNVGEPGEICDGNDLGGSDCTTFGFVNPAGLACDKQCQLDPKGCMAVCGNGVLEPGEQCDDGNVKPGDGCSDKCFAEGTTCALAIPIALAYGTIKLNDDTSGGGKHSAGCASGGTDRVYAVTVAGDGFLSAWLPRGQAGFDSVLWVSATCDDAAPVKEILCNDSKDPFNVLTLNGGEVISIPVKSGQTFYVYVDSAANAAGKYQIQLDLSIGDDCTDPIPIPIEAGTPMTLLGTTSNANKTTNGSCGGLTGPDVVYQVTRTSPGPLTFYVDPKLTSYNSVLYDRTVCDNLQTQQNCSYTANSNGGEQINEQFPQSPTFVWVDGTTQNFGTPQGDYGLVITP